MESVRISSNLYWHFAQDLLLFYLENHISATIYFNFRSLWWFISFRWLYNIVRILWVIVNNFYVIPAYFAWLIILFPVYFVSPITFWYFEDVLFGWLLNMVACWNYTGTEIIFPTSNIKIVLPNVRLKDPMYSRSISC